MLSKKELINLIDIYLVKHPEESFDVLDAARRGLNNFKAVKRKRDKFAVMAIAGLIAYTENPVNDGCDMLVNNVTDAIVHNFPKGWDSIVTSGSKEFLTKFIIQYDKGDLLNSYWEVMLKENGKYMQDLFQDERTKKLLNK